ncbi:H-NS histone family protein [Polycyclovorans algicola]|uniref:H-NS histone family protein n=1 Tax=Polycyclovorans algicola TaxID=616992 RepID=UPI0004A7492D|nr:H-NS histone family protein [Polycyclovorans algicola]
MPSYNELINQIEALKRQAEDVRRQELKSVIDEIKVSMEKYGITLSDLQSAMGRGGKKKTTVAPKYRNPAGGQTWTGRGRAPRWLADAEAKGQSRDAFLIR